MRTLLLGALAALAATVLAASAGAAKSWADPTGDSGTAPDITSVAVSNDAAGRITFTVGLVSHPALASDEGIGLYLDSDANGSTGIAYRYRPGIDYLVFLYSGNTWDFYTATNGSMTPTAHGSMSVTYAPTSVTVTIDKAQLGGATAPRFWVQTQKATASGALAASDLAPDAGQNGYSYTVTTFSKVVTKLQPASAANGVRPGARVAVAAMVGLSDGTTAAPTSVACTATVAGKPLPAAGSCAWTAPRTAAGKTIAIALTVGYGGQSYPASVSVRVLRK